MLKENNRPIRENQIIEIDGTKTRLQTADFDGDGITNEVETIPRDAGTRIISETTELGESLQELNLDTVDNRTKTASIDLRTHLKQFEISALAGFDACISMRIITEDARAIAVQTKRLKVSLDRGGRNDIVNIVSGKREMDAERGFGAGVKKFFGFGKGEGK